MPSEFSDLTIHEFGMIHFMALERFVDTYSKDEVLRSYDDWVQIFEGYMHWERKREEQGRKLRE